MLVVLAAKDAMYVEEQFKVLSEAPETTRPDVMHVASHLFLGFGGLLQTPCDHCCWENGE